MKIWRYLIANCDKCKAPVPKIFGIVAGIDLAVVIVDEWDGYSVHIALSRVAIVILRCDDSGKRREAGVEGDCILACVSMLNAEISAPV
ncbi:hypothetical protein [Burkholderia lata]|uniref:hypothetical protein n=1 Tax=Burkholderia lata (strain ATCC 17760 / DSM 23089 / LMG 22485 / NCIMB 9086 / R18194 / 383) TaxID=482957 RepID=UPI001581A814|nr:hypothetical protein [Burkholderia lata]